MVDISKENVTIAINVKSYLFLNSLAPGSGAIGSSSMGIIVSESSEYD